jgi:hypothetical protein
MKSCPFESNPEYIVMYHEGVMPSRLERRFADHLTTCQSCMETLLNLQNDLFLMDNMGGEPIPGELARRTGVLADQGKISAARVGLTGASEKLGALFKVIHEKLDMVGGKFGTGSFERIPAPAVRGKEQTSYEATVLGVRVRLFYEESDRFSVELKGVHRRSVELQREGRPCESHIDLKRDSFMIEGLPRGEYTLSIDDTHVMTFTVQ